MIDAKSHWENIYQTKDTNQVSWYQDVPQRSLELISRALMDKSAQIIDVGSGATTLIDALLARGFTHITALDFSEAALNVSKMRLGEQAQKVQWIVSEIQSAPLPENSFDLWHDRAVLHFLTVEKDRLSYVEKLKNSLRPNAQVIIATFAPDGPQQCSNLDVIRYSVEDLSVLLGTEFTLLESLSEVHHTPGQKEQKFIYARYGWRLSLV